MAATGEAGAKASSAASGIRTTGGDLIAIAEVVATTARKATTVVAFIDRDRTLGADDMKVRLDTARPMVYRIGALKDGGKDATLEAAVAKLYVSDCYVKSSLDAVQVFGGYGYMTEQQVERDVRDAVGSTLYSGTTEIQRNLIARCLGL